MHITLNITAPSNNDNDLLSLEIALDTTIGILKESVYAETSFPPSTQHLYHNGQLLNDDTKTMEQLSIGDGEMLALHVRDNTRVPAAPSRPARQQTASSRAQPDPETIRLQLLGNPTLRQQFIDQRPELAGVIDDPRRFAEAIENLGRQEQEAQRRRQEEIERLNDDPFDMDAQLKIAEMIREERVQENLQNAIEHTPEVFGRVHMLYIDVVVNHVKVKAFVDSGAQATIMSPSCAETCNIMRLVDKRFAGIARGVGTANILGRVHSADIKIGSLYLPCSFTVMEGKDVDLLLGLDMLKRYQASIDLAKDKLIIQGIEVPFLGEADIPKNMEEERAAEPRVAGPGGTSIGGRSGVVSATPGPQAPGLPASLSQARQPATPEASHAPQAPQAASPQPQQSQTPNISPQAVEQLVQLGFNRRQVIEALQVCGGNVELAAGLLFQG